MSRASPSPLPLAERLAALAAFLPAFSAPGATFGRWLPEESAPTDGGTFVMPWFELAPTARAFVEACYTYGWVADVDWGAWRSSREGRALYNDPEAMTRASPHELTLLLTALVRGDRFSEGTLAGAFTDGVLLRVVERAAALAAEGATAPPR